MAKTQSLTFKKFLRRSLVIAAIPVLLTGLVACSGDDGARGPAGADGATGATGPVTETNPACAVCHSSGKVLDINSDTAGTDTSQAVHYNSGQDANTTLTISDIAVTNFDTTGEGGPYVPQVTFHVDANGTAFTGLDLTRVRMYMADLVPAGAVITLPDGVTQYTTPRPYYEQWASENGVGTLTAGANDGDYVYTFTADFGVATAASGLYNADYNAADPQRLIIRVSGADEGHGTITGNTVGILDYMVPAADATVTAADLAQYQKAYVTIGTCNKCHGDSMQRAAHASGYLDTRACVICHSPLYGSSRHDVGFMFDDYAVMDQMVHEIHAAIASPGLGEEERGTTSPSRSRLTIARFAMPILLVLTPAPTPTFLTTGRRPRPARPAVPATTPSILPPVPTIRADPRLTTLLALAVIRHPAMVLVKV